MTQNSKMYDRGYKDGYNGRPENIALSREWVAYCFGWDAGNCDRPSLEELSMDVAKERSNPLGY